MEIEFDSDKRDKTLAERGLDFAQAGEVFAGKHFTAPDLRCEYGEARYLTAGSWMAAWLWLFGHHAAKRAASSA